MYKGKRTQPKPFYLTVRKGKRRIPVFYYRVFDDDGSLIGEWSTGCKNRDDALIHCTRLMDAGELIPVKGRKAGPLNPSKFRDYFADWYDWPKDQDAPNCPYIQKRLKRGKTYSRTTASIQRGNLIKYLFPYFGDRPKGRITRAEIEDWLYNLPDADPENVITPRTANNIFSTLRKMMTEAHRLGHIRSNPCTGIELLGTDPRSRDILRLPEVDKLFNRFKQKTIFPEPMAYMGTLLAAVTGMRTGEIRALRPSQIEDDHIVINAAIDNMYGNLKTTKNTLIRRAPIPERLRDHLREMAGDSDGFIFSEDGGQTPVGHRFFYDHFKYALGKIGIDETIRKERNLVFHGWRIFFNTLMQTNGIAEVKVRAIIGHLDESMTQHYTNVPVEEYRTEDERTIPQLQERIMRAAA